MAYLSHRRVPLSLRTVDRAVRDPFQRDIAEPLFRRVALSPSPSPLRTLPSRPCDCLIGVRELRADVDALEGRNVLEQFGRRALENHFAALEDARPVGDGECLTGVLLDHEHAHAFFIRRSP
jgi:hypothetical protein